MEMYLDGDHHSLIFFVFNYTQALVANLRVICQIYIIIFIIIPLFHLVLMQITTYTQVQGLWREWKDFGSLSLRFWFIIDPCIKTQI